MNENKVMVWIYTLITAVIAALATVFNVILEKHYVESGTGMYKAGTVTPEAFSVFMLVGVAVIIVSSIMFGKDNLPKGVYGLPLFTAVVSLAAAAVLCYSSVTFLMSFKVDTFSTASVVEKTTYIGSFVAFPAAIYYFISFLAGKSTEKIQAVFSFFPIIWTWIYLLGMYFDHTIEMNSPVRVIEELSLIALMIYQLMETRALLGKSKPRTYLMVASFAIIFLCPTFLPTAYEWISGDIILDNEISCAVYGTVMAVYILTRLLGYSIASLGLRKRVKKPKPGGIFSEEEEESIISEKSSDDALKEKHNEENEKVSDTENEGRKDEE